MLSIMVYSHPISCVQDGALRLLRYKLCRGWNFSLSHSCVGTASHLHTRVSPFVIVIDTSLMILQRDFRVFLQRNRL